MSVKLPKYARKPYDNRGEVIATERGWAVVLPSGKEEILWCVKGLKSKLEALEEQLQEGVDLQDAVDMKNLIDGDLKASEEDKEELDKSLFQKAKEAVMGEKKKAPAKKKKGAKKKDK